MKINIEFIIISTGTYLSKAKAWAPGHRFECITAIANCGTRLDDSVGVHDGIPPTSSSSARGVSNGGPVSGSGSSGSSLSSSSSSSSKSSSFFWTGFHHEHRPWYLSTNYHHWFNIWFNMNKICHVLIDMKIITNEKNAAKCSPIFLYLFIFQHLFWFSKKI